MTPRYTGIIPPLITPLLDPDTLDIDGLERLIEHVISGGVSGIFILGTTGEGPSLSYQLREQLVKRTLDSVAGRVPVLVGITDTSLAESVNFSNRIADRGVSALVTSAPYYFPAGQPELKAYLARVTSKLALPLMLYNMPALTKTVFSLEVINWALDQEKIIGLKDSSGDLIYFRKALRLAKSRRDDWSLLVGPEEILAEAVFAGGHGGVCGGANLAPRLFVDLFDSARSGDLASTQMLIERVLSFGESLYTVGQHGSAIIKALKCSLSLQGVCSDQMAPPFESFLPKERELIKSRLSALGLLP